MSRLKDEMEHLMDLSISGQIFAMLPFSAARKEHQRFNDLCFSGDAEPTTSDRFHETVGLLANLMKCHELNAVKLILITNATMLQDGNVIDAIDMLMQSNGEIWAKLDAGTPEHYQAINRSDISFDQILSNLEFAGRRWPLTIQTMMLEWKGQWPLDRELASYVNRIKRQMDSGAQIQKIQLYTVARPTPEPEALPLPPPILDKIANFVMGELAGLPVEVFYGSSI
jgi:wyosine [tRNA(Phe)-imidazoG37] synthetase (radical SAM superfamily)